MTCSRAVTTMPPLLEIESALWSALLVHLRLASGGVRESGAFLLGHDRQPRRAVAFLAYDALQTDALNDDFVELRSESFAKLWSRCRQEGVEVVADIHSHRYEAVQSWSDRINPMIAVRGHLALIVPKFAQAAITPGDLGIYRYEGAHAWTDFSGTAGVVQVVGGAL